MQKTMIYLSLSIFISLAVVANASETHTDQRLADLYKQIRCQVCQGESIDESQSKLASDMRLLIKHQVDLGKSDEQIKTFLVSRYGSSVLMETPVNIYTIWLWILPLLFMAIGGWLIVNHTKKKK